MKKLLFIFFISLGLFTSCVENPEEDPDPLPPPGNVTANIGDQAFSSTSSQVVINNVSMSLKATQADGSFFKITLPESPIIGTYTWSLYDTASPGFYLAYFENEGSVPFVAERDNIGNFAAFPSYIDTAELTILGIDRANNRISGSFRFTGVRFTDDTQTAIETRAFNDGQFLNLPYSTVAVVDPVNTTVRVKKITDTDADGTVSTIEYFYNGNKIVYAIDSEGLRMNIFYDGDLIAREEWLQGTTLVAKVFYNYENSKLVTYQDLDLVDNIGKKITYEHNANGTISFTEFSGDITTQDEIQSTGTISNTKLVRNIIDPITLEAQVYTNTFTFDAKNSPFINIVGYDKIYFADSEESLNYLNNITTNTEQIDAEPSTLFETITYTYGSGNLANYPTTVVHNSGSGVEEYTEVIEYY
jgi:hypothetical protein